MKTIYPAPSLLQVRPSFAHPGQFSLYWVVPETNLGTAVGNDLTLPSYPTAKEAVDSTIAWHGKQFHARAKPVVFVDTPMENMLVRISE